MTCILNSTECKYTVCACVRKCMYVKVDHHYLKKPSYNMIFIFTYIRVTGPKPMKLFLFLNPWPSEQLLTFPLVKLNPFTQERTVGK